MIEVRWHGRGGQGAVTSVELLAVAAIAAGTGAFLLWDESADTADQRALVVEPGLGSLLLRGTF